MKKYIYLGIIVVVLAVIWLLLTSSRPAVAPTTGTQPSSTAPAAGTSSVQSAYFSQRTSPQLGVYLTDPQGMTLYTFTHDSSGTSACAGACLEKWPPYGPGISAASGTAVNLPMLPAGVGAIAGNNGMVQFTWKGMPLYRYYGDKAPGDALGEGLLNAWYVVKL